jgi:putative endonuclease
MGNRQTHQTGLFAETLAAIFLMLCGYRILNRRFKTPVGEIDIIAKRGRTVAFVEVKRRMVMDDALAAISPDSVARIRRAAEWWLKSHNGIADKCDLRFDVIAIAPYARIRHIHNAF